MGIAELLEKLPKSIQKEIIDFQDMVLKDGRDAIRITVDRILSESERAELIKAGAIGVNCICQHRYAPEIKRSYFYMLV